MTTIKGKPYEPLNTFGPLLETTLEGKKKAILITSITEVEESSNGGAFISTGDGVVAIEVDQSYDSIMIAIGDYHRKQSTRTD